MGICLTFGIKKKGSGILPSQKYLKHQKEDKNFSPNIEKHWDCLGEDERWSLAGFPLRLIYYGHNAIFLPQI